MSNKLSWEISLRRADHGILFNVESKKKKKRTKKKSKKLTQKKKKEKQSKETGNEVVIRLGGE